MEIEVKEHKVIQAGQHTGKITAVMYRDTPMKYTDYIITAEEVDLRASFPTNITPETMHGKMLLRFGLQVVAGQTVDPNRLIGCKVQFTTINKTTPKGTFPEVMRDTLIPAPVMQQPQITGQPVKPPQPGIVPGIGVME